MLSSVGSICCQLHPQSLVINSALGDFSICKANAYMRVMILLQSWAILWSAVPDTLYLTLIQNFLCGSGNSSKLILMISVSPVVFFLHSYLHSVCPSLSSQANKLLHLVHCCCFSSHNHHWLYCDLFYISHMLAGNHYSVPPAFAWPGK